MIEIGLNEKFKFNFEEYKTSLHEILSLKKSSDIIKDSLLQFLDSLTNFYSMNEFLPVFIKSYEEIVFIDSLLIIFGKSEDHGLDPEQYHYSLVKEEFSKSIIDSVSDDIRYTHLVNTELLVCDAVLKYSYHLRYGLVNPKKIYPNDYFLPVIDSSKIDLLEPLKQKNIFKYLFNILPRGKRYKDLQSGLHFYFRFKDIKWPKIPQPDKKLEVGEADSTIAFIIERLITLEFLDTSDIHIKDYTIYDTLLVASIKNFQRVNGLNDDGIIGKSTIEKLNITPHEYISKIKLNLERFRWNNYPDTSSYVLVNIPDFRLFIYNNSKEIFTTKVCVGRNRRSDYEDQINKFNETKHWEDKPEDWQTPVTNGEISYIVLNPTWSVPKSIIREEIFQKVSEDSNYLIDHNFKVYSDTSEVDPSQIALSDLSSEEIQYKIVQGPGAANALGKIKFIFINRFGIYLHDTPTRPPFKYSNRAVSHGCIRVENPMPLAEFFLKDNPDWNIDFLKIEIGQKIEDKSKIAEYRKMRENLRKNEEDDITTEIYLTKTVPLFIDYYTAWVDKNGVVNFRDDVYGKDKLLVKVLSSLNQL